MTSIPYEGSDAQRRLNDATIAFDLAKGQWWKAIEEAREHGATIENLSDDLGMSEAAISREFDEMRRVEQACRVFDEMTAKAADR